MKLIFNLVTHATRSLSFVPLAVCSLALLAPSRAEAISLLSNGSFETPVGPAIPGLNSVRPTGWSGFGSFVNGVVNGSGVTDGLGASYSAPQHGNQFVDIGTGDLFQTFTVINPGDYQVTWFENSLTTGWNGSYGVFVQDSSLLTINFSAYSYAFLGSVPWTARSLELSALAAGTYTLRFGSATTYTFLDNVAVDLKTTTSVPDTGSTAGLLALAFGGVALLARKRAMLA